MATARRQPMATARPAADGDGVKVADGGGAVARPMAKARRRPMATARPVSSNRPFVADEKETEHQIQSREARIEALEAALRARDRQLDALIAQSLERSGIALMGPAIGAAADADALETALPRRSTRRSVPPT